MNTLHPMRWYQSVSLLMMTLLAVTLNLQAQQPTGAQLKLLQRMDDSLGDYGNRMLDEAVVSDRLRADSMFTRILVRALRVPHSFRFQFDSMQVAPVVYAPDSSFRLITWHLPMNEDNFRQKGTLQMNTSDGSLKMFPLFDISDYSENLLDSIRTPQNWVGAVYYKILKNEAAGKPVYTLIGYDENNNLTSRKWIDILTFGDNGNPQWGGNYFVFNNDSIFPKGAQRYLVEYKKEGRARVNYDDEDSLIVMDHLVSESNEPEKKFTLIPGGDYEALKWKNGSWNFIDRLFMEQRGDGNEPTPMKILTDDGLADEDALMKQSEKNVEKAEKEAAKKTPPKSTSTKPPAKKKSGGG